MLNRGRVLSVLGARIPSSLAQQSMLEAFRQAEFEITYGEGISRTGDIVDIAAEIGIIDKKGAWYAYQGENIGQGRANTKIFLDENPEIRETIADTIYANIMND